MKKPNYKTISYAAKGISTAGALAKSFATQAMFNTLFTNRPSKLGRLMFGEGPEDPVPQEYHDWLKAQPQETLYTTSIDGYRLKAHYFANPRACRNVILVHGWHGNWSKDMALQARLFYENDCNVLILEQRAQGSEGRCMTMGILEACDCRKWIDVIMAKNDLGIFVYGISMGGSTVGILAGKNLPIKVRGLIIDCGFTSPAAILNEVGHSINPLLPRLFMGPINDRLKMLAGVSLYSAKAETNIRMAKMPVLIIHGSKDDFVPTYMGEALFKACDSRKKLIIVKGAGHCMSFVQRPDYLMREIRKFFRWDNTDIALAKRA